MDTLDLFDRMRNLSTRLRAVHEQRRWEAVELWAINSMIEIEFASILQHIENDIEMQRCAYERAHAEIQQRLEQAKHHR